ncbi:MAG: alpha/beta hydrolase-fold protein [Eubacteriales bacterium]|nr:alpha/beta hydrolase-fold protein [Eubacteriales bacterium]
MIIKRDICFTPADRIRRLHIYLPESYSNGQDRYPVMYFFDGHNLFENEEATFGKSWGLKEFLDQWEKEILIVGIECGHEGNERLREYCPYTFHGKFWGGTLRGTGYETLQWIVSELKPLIDRDYRTWPHREATGIGGSSMGGLMSLCGAVCYNEWFSKAACVSSTISPCMTPLRRDIRKNSLREDTRIYLSWGTEEAFRPHPSDPMQSRTALQNLTIRDDLRAKNVKTDLFCQIGGQHNEASWEQQIPRFMDFLWR